MAKQRLNHVLIILVLIYIGGIVATYSFNEKDAGKTQFHMDSLNPNDLKTSGFWNLTGSPIYIYGDSGWSWYSSNEDWCSGSGTYSDPYLIENVTIDGEGSNTCIEIINTNAYFTIRNCTIYNAGVSETGIQLTNSDNGKVEWNHIWGCRYGIMLISGSNNNTIQYNNASNNADGEGVYLTYADNNKIQHNIANDNDAGINVARSRDIMIFNNTVNNNRAGVYLWDDVIDTKILNNTGTGNYYQYTFGGAGVWMSDNCTYITIANNTFYGNSRNTIYGTNQCNNNRIEDNTLYNNGGSGVEFYDNCYGNIITRNNCTGNYYGIQLESYCDDNRIFDNDVIQSDRFGIWIWEYSENNTVQDNYIYDNDEQGILLMTYSHENIILGNNITGNREDGIVVSYCGQTEIHNNEIVGNSWDGLDLSEQIGNNVTHNIIAYNGGDGVEIYNSDFNLVDYNTILGNSEQGIDLNSDSDNTNVTFNDIWNNVQNGINIEVTCNYTLIWQNNFTGNMGGNAYDNAVDSWWSGGMIGNYWSDYAGLDEDDNGIGDTPYSVPGSGGNQDIYPIFSDGDDILIIIVDPSSDELFGDAAPNFTVIYDEPLLNETWYSLDNGATNITFTNNGTINEGQWDLQGNGTVTITFYGNTTYGLIDSKSIELHKDIFAPTVMINNPSSYELFGVGAPDFDLSITEANLNTTWYTLDGGTTNITFSGLTGAIDQTLWGLEGNGTVTIRFYANDSMGNLGFAEITLRKDIIAPLITINDPTPYDLLGVGAPDFDLSITEANLNTTWYTLDGGTTNKTFSGLAGTINQTLWALEGNGTVTIRFYANDSMGNVEFAEVVIRKDIIEPSINIVSPTPFELFGATSPGFTVEINDTNLAVMWYSLNGIANQTFSVNETFRQDWWSILPNGTILITFYANDTLGNLATDSVPIRLDNLAPTITILSPKDGEVFNGTAPDYIVEVSDIHLNTIWYSLDGGLTNISIISNGTIDQNNWTLQSEGVVSISFYANDSRGNHNVQSVSVIKDISLPLLSISNPAANSEFGNQAPEITCDITEVSLNTTWYQIIGIPTNFTFAGIPGENVLQIDQSGWDSLEVGDITIIIYANDSLGRIGTTQIIVTKVGEPVPLLEDPLLYVLLMILGTILGVLIVIFKKKSGHKSSQKERERIQHIVD